MGWKARGLASALMTLSLLAPCGAALADAIDGHWCFSDGRRLSIRGPQLVTPGGKRMTGDYERHAFSYVAPSGEPGAGSTVYMVLLNEEMMWLKVGAPPTGDADAETWRRCSEQISRAAGGRAAAGG